MLKWIQGSKSDHPLADEKAASEVIAELPPLDPHKSEDLHLSLATAPSASRIPDLVALERRIERRVCLIRKILQHRLRTEPATPQGPAHRSGVPAA